MQETSLWLWLGFTAIIIALLVFDLAVIGRKSRTIGTEEALLLTGGYIGIGLLFGAAVFGLKGSDAGMAYLTGFVLEKSLSVDNIFVFVLIFDHFRVPSQYQHRVLFWGVLGALVMRGLMIVAGATLLNRFDWIIYAFGIVVIASGARTLFKSGEKTALEDKPLLRFLRRHMRATSEYHEHRFFVRRDGSHYATPLLVCLVMIELTDLIFALDSIPAIFGVTRDPFIVYTSNAFAILGMRALYFAVAGLLRRFEYLHYGLSIVLILIGTKMLVEGIVEIPVWIVLSVTVAVIAGSILLSLAGPSRRTLPRE